MFSNHPFINIAEDAKEIYNKNKIIMAVNNEIKVFQLNWYTRIGYDASSKCRKELKWGRFPITEAAGNCKNNMIQSMK